MPDPAQMAAVFAGLARIFAPYQPPLIATTDEPGHLNLQTPASQRYPDGFFFGMVKIGKRYVSFHLMPVYTNPELLQTIGPELRTRMHGKSCFNFTRLELEQIYELERLTAEAFTRYQRDGLIPAG